MSVAVTARAQPSYFTSDPVWRSTSAEYSRSVAVGDLNGDGFLDLIFANGSIAGAVSTIYLSRNGSFPPTPSWVCGQEGFARDVALGDVNHDGHLDAVFGHAGGVSGDFSSLYLNDGSGFPEFPVWSSGFEYATASVALADLNNDGLLDLVCANVGETRGHNTVYFNVGGTFSPDTVWASRPSYNANSVAVGDVNGDGYLDLVFGNGIDNTGAAGQPETLYLNHGGVLSRDPDWMSEPHDSTTSVALGDVNGDGLLDLVCGNGDGPGPAYGRKNVMYLNQGGVFSTKPDWESALSEATHSVALGDVDGDGRLDLVCGNTGMPNTLYLNVGGALSSAPVWESSDTNATWAVALGDANADGHLDLVCANNQQSSAIYLNESSDLEVEASWLSARSAPTQSVALGDVTGDGRPDLACGNSGSAAGPCTLYQGENDWFSPDTVWASSALNFTAGVALGDIDRDGWLDLVCGNQGLTSPEQNTAYLNHEGVLSRSPGWVSNPREYTLSVALGDVNNDGWVDLVCGNGHNAFGGASNSLYLNEQGILAPDTSWTSSSAHITTSVALGDVNNDGWIDLVCGNGGAEEQVNELYFNDQGTFGRTPVWVSGEKKNTSDVALGDIDGDGDLDLVCGDFNAPTTLYLNEGGIFAKWPAWSTITPSRVSEVLLEDMDADGDLDLICGTMGEQDALYENENGTLKREPVWTSNESSRTMSIALDDCDGDGDFDLAAGNNLQPSSLHRGTLNPPFQGNLSSPANHLPNNSPFIKQVQVDRAAPNVFQVQLTAYDVESDPVWILPEYQFEGDATWHAAEIQGRQGKIGPLSTSPAGTAASFQWELLTIPFDARNIVMRLRTIEAPQRVSIIQHSTSYLKKIGPIPSIAAHARPTSGDEFLEGRDIIVELSLPSGATSDQARLYFRRGGESAYQQSGFDEGTPLPIATISSDWTGARGIEYWVELQTSAGVLTDPRVDPFDRPKTIRNTALNLEETETHPGERYRLMSIPLDLEGSLSIIRTVRDDIGFPDPVRWRMFAYDGGGSQYVEIPNDSISSFEQGRGYWLVTRDGHRLDTAPVFGASTPTDSAFVIVLRPGWNLIGHPFAFRVSWDSMTVDGSPMSDAEMSLVEPARAWIASKNTYNDPVTAPVESFFPFDGYWVRNLTDSALVFRIPPRESSALSQKDALAANPQARRDAEIWSLGIKAISGPSTDQGNYVGMRPDAREGWDRNDRSETPMCPGNGISLYFPHPAWEQHAGNYTADIRGERNEGGAAAEAVPGDTTLWGEIWRIDVAKNFSDGAAGDEVVLHFSGIESVPPQASAILVDRELARRIDLRRQRQYSFFQGIRTAVTKEEDARFVLIVGSKDFLDSQETKLPKLPTRTVLYQNRPNPFNPSTIIRYDLAHGARVSLRVYDVSGALVKVLENRDRPQGRYEIYWNGDNEQGERVGTGVYFYRLSAGNQTTTKKMLLLR